MNYSLTDNFKSRDASASKNSLTFVEKHGSKIAKQNDTFRYCSCSSSAINIDNVTRSSMNERSTGDQTSS